MTRPRQRKKEVVRSSRGFTFLICPDCGVKYSVSRAWATQLRERYDGRCPECRTTPRQPYKSPYHAYKERNVAAVLVPCGGKIVPKAKSRCDEYISCPSMLACLNYAAKNDWPGWRKQT